MGMSTHVTGFRPPDEKWKQMKAVWEACERAAIKIPPEVLDFFGDANPDDRGVAVDLEDTDCCKEYDDEGEDGFEIDVRKLPKDVTVIRFYNSY